MKKTLIILFTLSFIQLHAQTNEYTCNKTRSYKHKVKSNTLPLNFIQETEKYDVVHYDLDLTANNMNTNLSGIVKMTGIAKENLDTIVFELFPSYTINSILFNQNTTKYSRRNTGIHCQVNVKKGEKVAGNSFNVGTEILRIANMDKIEVRVDVGESDIPKVKLGDSALVEIDAYSDRKFKGIVTQIASSNNGAASQNLLATTSTDVTQYKVFVRLLPESYADLLGKGTFPFRPGMSANADIQTKTKVNVLSLPINAVTTRDKNEALQLDKKKEDESATAPATSIDDLEVLVFVVDKEYKVKKVKVKTGIQDINYIEIIDGLKEGEEVVTGPYDVVSKTLKEGDEVKKVDKKELFEKK